MRKNVLHSYYIGQPSKPNRRGQDKYRRVHCLCWMLIYRKGYGFAEKDEYSMAISGGVIGRGTKSVKKAKQIILKNAIDTLEGRRAGAEDELNRINKALRELRQGGIPALEKTEGKYRERDL